MNKICEICDKPINECGHICSLDYGELYCPVCFPGKPSGSDE